MPALPRLLLAAPMSGSGKTTITAGLIAALTARGLSVAPFKCGPDYIDPGYHALASGRACFNLDAWLTPPEQIAGILARRSTGADLTLIEGVMGLFDGYSGADDTGSSAHIARLTATPVVIVLDARAMARTAAALVAGLRDFDRRLSIAGVILNRIGSLRHAQMVQEAVEGSVGVPVIGYLQRDDALTLPERHLGLIPVAEPGRWQAWLSEVRQRVEATIDLDRLIALARAAPPLVDHDMALPRFESVPAGVPPIIAVARDEAFSFLYEDNLDLLRAAGATIAFFSPLRDTALPEGTAALYLCGGYPELYAECGGLMYLTEAIIDAAGQTHPMVGALAGRSVMTSRLTLGYRTARVGCDTWLWREGETLRGHEFHYSVWEERPTHLPWLYTCLPDAMRPTMFQEGAMVGNTLASYIHMHFLAYPHAAQRFVAAAAAFRHGATV